LAGGRLPLGGRNARGKAIINLLPIQQGVSIAAIMPIDAPEEDWKDLQIVFANSAGGVRRNALSDFTNVKSNGKIAMKLPEGVTIVDVHIATEDDDFFLTTSLGKAIRFPTTDVRVFKGRDSLGVRGIRLAKDDYVVSMAVIRHVEATPDERGVYFKMRRAMTGEEGDEIENTDTTIANERYEELAAVEQWILTITKGGFGKRSSALEYRVSGRGGQGVAAANLGRRDDRIIASFTVEDEDQIMLATSTGQSIRCPVAGISRQGRTSSGVTVFSVGKSEEVVSVAYIAESSDEADEAEQTEE